MFRGDKKVGLVDQKKENLLNPKLSQKNCSGKNEVRSRIFGMWNSSEITFIFDLIKKSTTNGHFIYVKWDQSPKGKKRNLKLNENEKTSQSIDWSDKSFFI